VSALADQLEQQCQALKGGPVCLEQRLPLSISPCFVSNIVRGAKAAPAAAPAAAAGPAAAPTPMAASSLQGGEEGGAAEGSSSPSALQVAYQRLCTCVLLRCAATVLLVPEQEAWRTLAAYNVGVEEGEGLGLEEGEGVRPEQQQQQQQQQQFAALGHQDGVEGAAQGPAPGLEVKEAAEQDPDDMEFEPLEAGQQGTLEPAPHIHHKALAAPQGSRWGAQGGCCAAPFPWSVLAIWGAVSCSLLPPPLGAGAGWPCVQATFVSGPLPAHPLTQGQACCRRRCQCNQGVRRCGRSSSHGCCTWSARIIWMRCR